MLGDGQPGLTGTPGTLVHDTGLNSSANDFQPTNPCHPTRHPDERLYRILFSAVNPLRHLPLVPQLSGADALTWWSSHYQADPQLQDPKFIQKYQITKKDDFWYYNKNLLVVPSVLRPHVLAQCHDSLQSAHMGVTKTLKNVQRSFWWPGYRQDVTLYVKHCLSCARNKPAQHKPHGLLSPLPVPDRPWDSVSMDFITDFPLTQAKHDAILVVVDRLSKMTHFIPCANTCTAQQAAEMLFTHIFRLHGSPSSFVVDRDPLWRSSFFQSWCALVGHRSADVNCIPPTD